MKAELTATIEDGVLKPDIALPFADHTRVKLTIEPVTPETTSAAAWERVEERLRERPVHGLAATFSREQFYERG